MNEQGFGEAVKRLERVNEVVGKLDPAVRAPAFALLSRYVSGSETADLGGLATDAGASDIEGIAFTVLREAAKDADRDLEQILNEIRSVTAAKRRLRGLICKVADDLAANAGSESEGGLSFGSTGLGSEEAYHHAPLPVPDPRCGGGVQVVVTDLHQGPITSVAQLQGIREALEAKLDSMNEISTFESLQLQMAMDRRSKAMAILSNIMKKISDTQCALVRNLK